MFSRRRVFDLVVDEPAQGASLRRLQRFAGFVQSGAPVPPFRILLHGVEQRIERHDLGDPGAPRDRRFTAYFVFHFELPPAWTGRDIALEVMADRKLIATRTFHVDGPDDRTDRPLVLMMHIPKTAGTSLRLALEMRPELRLVRLYNDRSFLPFARLPELSAAAFDDVDVVFGHFAYGFHGGMRRDCRYATVLRHPADILRSGYLFYKYVAGTIPQGGSPEEAFFALGGGPDNTLTRYLTGNTSPAPITDADLAEAIANLDRHFDVVGMVEDMDATLGALGDYLGVPLDRYDVNRTPPTPESDAFVRDEVMRRFASHIRHDLELYAYARDTFAGGVRPAGLARR